MTEPTTSAAHANHLTPSYSIVALLVAATVVAFAMGDNIEAVAILVVIVINAGIGFLTEWKAEQALSALQNSRCESPM